MSNAYSCPCCGYNEDPAKPSVSLDSNVLVYRGAKVQVSPQQASLLIVLNEKYGRVMPNSYINSRVYGWLEPDTASRVMKVQACKLRKRLRPIGLDIESLYGVGMKLAPRVEAASA